MRTIQGWENLYPVHETSDFSLIWIVRQIMRDMDHDHAKQLLESFPFWYNPQMKHSFQVFWTENHYISYCSSHFLLLQLEQQKNHKVETRVRRFIQFKLNHGMAEFLSPVYLPYTIASLLNLIDFCTDTAIKTQSCELLDSISQCLLAFTLKDGSLFSPSARVYPSYRTNIHNQHIHAFTRFLLEGKQPECQLKSNKEPRLLHKCLTETSYKPSHNVYKFHEPDSVQVTLKLSPSLDELLEFVNHQSDPDIGFLWMHGGYVIPQTCEYSLRFMDKHNLWAHHHFHSFRILRMFLFCVPTRMLSKLIRKIISLRCFSPYCRGALLTDASVYLFREGNVLLSSLVDYNCQLQAAQQWPWTVNLSGVPVWAVFSEPLFAGQLTGNFKHISSAGIIPYMIQKGNRLEVLYDPLLKGWRDKRVPLLHWDTAGFDEHGSEPLLWARIKSSFVGCIRRENCLLLYVCDLSIRNFSVSDAMNDALSGSDGFSSSMNIV